MREDDCRGAASASKYHKERDNAHCGNPGLRDGGLDDSSLVRIRQLQTRAAGFFPGTTVGTYVHSCM